MIANMIDKNFIDFMVFNFGYLIINFIISYLSDAQPA